MRGAGIIGSERKGWGQSLMRFIALLAVALHVFTLEGHVHPLRFDAAAASGWAGASAAQDAHTTILAAPTESAPCVFCQTMAAAGAGIAPNAPLLPLWLGAAALIAALFGQRQVALQRLTIWRSRAPPLPA